MGGRGASSASAWKRQTTFEQAIAIATAKYDAAKNTPSVADSIPDWVLKKKLSDSERDSFRVGDGAFVKHETEKAYLIANNTDFGQVSFWMPKSWMSTPEQIRADAIQGEARFLVGANYNTYLKQTAESAGVKLGNIKRTAGIQEKLKKKGVQFVTKDEFGSAKGTKIEDVKFRF